MKQRAQLELLVKDLEDSQLSEEQFKSKIENQLQELEQEINAKQTEVDQIAPQYTQVTESSQQMRVE